MKARPINTYRTEGDVTFIALYAVSGELIAETMIDAGDLDKAAILSNKWYARWDKNGNCFYVVGFKGDTKTYPMVILHRALLDCPLGMQVDHINHDTLDNRRANLRTVTPSQNKQNNRGSQKNSKTGVRGVCQLASGRYEAYASSYRKQVKLGTFLTVEEAAAAAAEGRKRLMTHSPENKDSR